jgi:hypothetical protein
LDLSGLQAFDAEADSLGDAVYDGADGLQVGGERSWRDARYLLADAALLLGETASDDASSGNRLFTAYFAYSRHQSAPF